MTAKPFLFPISYYTSHVITLLSVCFSLTERQLSPARALPQANYGHPFAAALNTPPPPSLLLLNPRPLLNRSAHSRLCAHVPVLTSRLVWKPEVTTLVCLFTGFLPLSQPLPLHHILSPPFCSLIYLFFLIFPRQNALQMKRDNPVSSCTWWLSVTHAPTFGAWLVSVAAPCQHSMLTVALFAERASSVFAAELNSDSVQVMIDTRVFAGKMDLPKNWN